MKDVRDRMLHTLLRNRGDWVSGGDLSKDFGVSRVSVKNYVDQWVKEGYQIEAVRNRGYLLEKEPSCFHQAGVEYHSRALELQGSLVCFEELDSTNTELDRMLNAGAEAPICVIAGRQSNGKGRRGNQWESDSNSNLYVSAGFRPNIEVMRMGSITLWVGLQLARLLRETYAIPCMVKWPNDLYVEGRKLAGILSEAKIDTDHVQHLIIGLGLNVNRSFKSSKGELKKKATALCEWVEGPLEFAPMAAKICECLMGSAQQYFSEILEDQILEAWEEFDFLKDRKVIAKRPANELEGTAKGINSEGHLILELENGEMETVHSGEVTLRFDANS